MDNARANVPVPAVDPAVEVVGAFLYSFRLNAFSPFRWYPPVRKEIVGALLSRLEICKKYF